MNNKKPLPQKPVYLVSETSPLIPQYENVIEQLNNTADLHTLMVTIATEQVTDKECGYLNELICVFQHTPKLIKQLVFAISFKFLEVPDSELYIKEEDWKNDPDYWLWFRELGIQSPVAPFFIHDHEARFLCIAGDLLAEGRCKTKPVNNPEKCWISFEGEELKLVANRLFEASFLYHMYCHGLGFDPRDTIEWLITDLGIPISYKQIRDEYKKKIKQGRI
jgi:hypothetical protein